MIQTIIRHPVAVLATLFVAFYCLAVLDDSMKGTHAVYTCGRLSLAIFVGVALWVSQ